MPTFNTCLSVTVQAICFTFSVTSFALILARNYITDSANEKSSLMTLGLLQETKKNRGGALQHL